MSYRSAKRNLHVLPFGSTQRVLEAIPRIRRNYEVSIALGRDLLTGGAGSLSGTDGVV
jgi:hypothetical protein